MAFHDYDTTSIHHRKALIILTSHYSFFPFHNSNTIVFLFVTLSSANAVFLLGLRLVIVHLASGTPQPHLLLGACSNFAQGAKSIIALPTDSSGALSSISLRPNPFYSLHKPNI
jgi:hypothetical protein